ncbi:MAG: hypothetical protein ACYSWP_18470 [Planctomycetota bacterium]|jgi:hypothetical protein
MSGVSGRICVIQDVLAYYTYRRFLPKTVALLGKLMAPSGARLFVRHYWSELKLNNDYP